MLASLEPASILLGNNAPADNMVSESILGFMNNVVRKCPNASQMYVPSKSCFSLNNTYSWLDSLDDT